MILLPRAVASTRVTAYFRISALLVGFGLGLMLSLSAITVAPVAHAQDSAQACGAMAAGDCRIAGLRAQFGLGVAQNKPAALTLFEAACDLGDPLACTEAGVAHASGNGTRIDRDTARTFYLRGCKPSRKALCRDHGLSYLDPKSPIQNLQKGITILSQACVVGSVSACEGVAQIHASGAGGRPPLIGKIDSIRFNQLACTLGSSEACMRGAALVSTSPALSLFSHTRASMLRLACQHHFLDAACVQLSNGD